MKANEIKSNDRNGERGAALVVTLLLSTLLLAAGGTLILTSALTGTNAIDSTTEMQSYYAAEAGVSQALSVLRGNIQSNPAGTRATFRNVVSNPNLWTPLAGGLIAVPGSGTAFRITSVLDPDDPTGAIRAGDASYEPMRLRIQVTGFGPKNSQKQMEVVIRRLKFDFPVNSTITIPNQSADPITFKIGDSNVTKYKGIDAGTHPQATIPAFGVAGSDQTGADHVLDGCSYDGTQCNGNGPNVDPGDAMVLDDTNTPDFLKSVANARLLLDGPDGLAAMAHKQGRYFETGAAAIASSGGLGGTNPNGILTFVDGDLTLGPGNPTGQGMLVVTGTLTLDGNFNFNGVIFVLGEGTVLRTGGGHGNIFGAMYVAKFERTGEDTDLFGAATFDISGGGTANIQFNSTEVEKAKSSTGHQVLGVHEF